MKKTGTVFFIASLLMACNNTGTGAAKEDSTVTAIPSTVDSVMVNPPPDTNMVLPMDTSGHAAADSVGL